MNRQFKTLSLNDPINIFSKKNIKECVIFMFDFDSDICISNHFQIIIFKTFHWQCVLCFINAVS